MKRSAIRPSIPERSEDPRVEVSLTVNGQPVKRTVSVRMLLSDFLRHELGLTGTHVGCEHGVCGCCTVQIDGKAGRSCLTLAVQASGCTIRTIEDVADEDGVLHPVQQAWIDLDVPQCGYCQSGMLMAVAALLREKPKPTDADIDAAITNICRCGSYQRVRAAIHAAANA